MKDKEGTVAIITRTKNRVLLLERALKSVLNQTYSNYIHVIINDGGPQEEVNSLLDKYEEKYNERLHRIHNKISLGMEAAANKGIRSVDSDYVTIHDDDDSWEKDFLKKTIHILQKNEFPTVKGVVTHTTQIFEKIEENNITELWRKDFDPWLNTISLPFISEINRYMPISFIYERSVLDEVGYYDENLPVIGDWEFNIRYFSKFDVIVLKENLANYYIREKTRDAKYNNTVTIGQDAHLFYRDLIVNKHIRKDIEEGKLSIGMLLMQGDYFYRTSFSMTKLVGSIEKLKKMRITKFIKKIFK